MSLMVMWARPTFLSVMPFQYISLIPSWMNFFPVSVRFLYSVHCCSALLNWHSIAAIWGPVLLGGMMAAVLGKSGSMNGGVLFGVAAAYSAAVSTAPKYPCVPPPRVHGTIAKFRFRAVLMLLSTS